MSYTGMCRHGWRGILLKYFNVFPECAAPRQTVAFCPIRCYAFENIHFATSYESVYGDWLPFHSVIRKHSIFEKVYYIPMRLAWNS